MSRFFTEYANIIVQFDLAAYIFEYSAGIKGRVMCFFVSNAMKSWVSNLLLCSLFRGNRPANHFFYIRFHFVWQ